VVAAGPPGIGALVLDDQRLSAVVGDRAILDLELCLAAGAGLVVE
jgi:hypothetical protein